MPFTAPPAPSAPFYIGKGILGANSVELDIFGTAIPNSLSTSGLTAPYSIVNATTLFDASALTENHEVPVVLYVSPNSTSGDTTYVIKWYRKRDSRLIFQISSSLPAGSNPGSSTVAWIGWLSDSGNGVATYPTYREIQENGDYYANISASGGETFSQDIDFTVEGIPANTYAESSATNAFDWTVRLSDYFDTSNYIQAGICTDPFTDGQSTAPTGILDSVSAPVSNTGCAATGTVTGVTSGTTYTLYGFAQAASGDYFQAGSFTITMSGRPPLFNWTTPKVQGDDMPAYSGQPDPVTADEWNALINNVNEMYTYLGDTHTPQTTVTSGQDLTASIYMDMYIDIAALSPPTGLPGGVSSGNPVTAAKLNGLVDSINSIT